MNHKIFLIAVAILIMGYGFAPAQTRSEATDVGATLVSGAFSFSSQGGDLYENTDDKRYTVVALVPGFFYFVAPGLGIGGDVSYNRESQGDASFTFWGVGPKIGYFIDSGTDAIPFFSGGLNYISFGDGSDSEGGLRFKFGGGVLIRNGHLAVAIEAGYVWDRFKFEGASEATTGNSIAIGIGLAGFLY